MKVIILAAGLGSRLKDKTKEFGKAMVYAKGLPLIDYALQFTKIESVSLRYVVGGFGYEILETHLKTKNHPRIELLKNEDFKKGNLLTLKAALKAFDDDILIMNVDHIYNPAIFTLVTNNISGITGIVDSDRNLMSDDMKVLIDDWGRIVDIDKSLTDYSKGYVGMTTISRSSIPIYLSAVEYVSRNIGENANVEAVLRYLSTTETKPKTLDISGFGWLEIDTQEELLNAEKALNTHPQRYPYFH